MRKTKPVIISSLLSVALLTACTSASKGTFMEKQGLSLSPQGAFSFDTKAYDRDGNELDITENVNVVISETSCDDRNGYKIVEAVFEADMSELPEGYRFSSWQLAFDKYTGTSFEYYQNAEDEQPSEFIFDCLGDKTDVQMSYESSRDNEAGILTITIRGVCPEDYDGTVFQMGYSDKKINEADRNWSYSERLYTLDELPGFDTNGHEYYYFSYGDYVN